MKPYRCSLNSDPAPSSALFLVFSAASTSVNNEDTGLNVGPDDVSGHVKVDSDELPLQGNKTWCMFALTVTAVHRSTRRTRARLRLQLSSRGTAAFLNTTFVEFSPMTEKKSGEERNVYIRKRQVNGTGGISGICAVFLTANVCPSVRW